VVKTVVIDCKPKSKDDGLQHLELVLVQLWKADYE
jgi:hypothetical protein